MHVSSSPSFGREDWPLNCITWEGAQRICRAFGGDSPTEAQWEYAASAAGRAAETIYPWGNDSPRCVGACSGQDPDLPCHEAVIARFSDGCVATGFGPLPVGAIAGDDGDEVAGAGGASWGWPAA